MRLEPIRSLVEFVARDLWMFENNPLGVGAVGADGTIQKLKTLKAELDRLGVPAPKLTMPKIKVVVPNAYRF